MSTLDILDGSDSREPQTLWYALESVEIVEREAYPREKSRYELAHAPRKPPHDVPRTIRLDLGDVPLEGGDINGEMVDDAIDASDSPGTSS